MDIFTTLVIYVLGMLAVMIVIFNGLFYGAMYTRISRKRLRKLVELGKLKENMVVYDLGAGFGRIMFEAAKSGANVVGYEVDQVKVYWIQQQIKKKLLLSNGLLNMSVIHDNLLNADLSVADVVYCYLAPGIMEKLGQKAVREMKHGSRLISAEHRINMLKPVYEDGIDKIYMYQF